MIRTHEAQDLLTRGGTVVGAGEGTIGRIGQIYLDDGTGEPEWVTVRTGLFGDAESFVPLRGATLVGTEIHVAFDEGVIVAAPRVVDPEGHLSAEDEAGLYRFYGLDTPGSAPAPEGVGDLQGSPAPRDPAGPASDDAMTRSEEHLVVGTERVAAGTARLRRFVVTERVTRTVPVRHDEIRIEREPLTDVDHGVVLAGGELNPAEHVVVLTGERLLVDRTTVPVERVRLHVDAVSEEQQVTEEVRTERIQVDGEVAPREPVARVDAPDDPPATPRR
jgi:uncharacterized protein (TIGR02271 family)